LILFAYDLPPFRLVDGPGWLTSDRWQIEARAASPQTTEQMRKLVRRMLQDNFGLGVEAEARQLPASRVRVANKDGRLGPGIRPSPLDCMPFIEGTQLMADSPRDSDGVPICANASFKGDFKKTTLRVNGVTIPVIIRRLEALLGRALVDETGLQGRFDLELTYRAPALPGMELAPDPDAPTPSTAATQETGCRRRTIAAESLTMARTD